MTRCLLVDDDAELRRSIREFLQQFDLDVATAADGAEMRHAMAETRFDVVVLDLMLPGEDGLSLCRWIQQGPGVPVIMLTAQSDPISRVVGLEMGADDYLGKPFEPRELVARIHALQRRASKRGAVDDPASAVLEFAGWRFDRLRHELDSPGGVRVELSNAEFRLLSAFVDRPKRVLTRERLIELTRAPGVEVNDRSVDLGISRLRQKLRDAPNAPHLIRTLRGEGYLFDAEVRS